MRLFFLRKMILYVLTWINWSETRWCKIKRSSRYFLRTLAIGVQGLVRIVLDDPCACKTHLKNWFSYSTTAVKRYFIIASCSSDIPEAILFELMKDDRFLRFGAQWRQLLNSRLFDIAHLPPLVWQYLASVVGDDWHIIRHECISRSVVGCGYLEHQVFSELDVVPWKWTQGDIDENLNTISGFHLPDIVDYLTRKIKIGLSLGIDRSVLQGGLLLLRDGPSSTNVVEKGHAAGTCLSRDHSTYNYEMLRERAALISSAPLVSLDRWAKPIQKAEAKLAQLEAKKPQSINGHSMLVQEIANARHAAGYADGEVLFLR